MGAEGTRTRVERGQELELAVESLAHGGAGVARHEGYVVFVTGAVPGDRVRAVVTKRKRAFAEARTLEVVTPSPERVAPVAPGHPGASWQVLPYERQLAVKTEQVDDALRRIGKLDGFALDPIVPAQERWRYRNKLEYSFGAGPDGELVCGFHKPGSWEEVVHVEDDLLASEALNAARRRIVDWARAQGLRGLDRRSGAGPLRNLVLREGKGTGELQARLVTGRGADLDVPSLTEAAAVDGLFWTQVAGDAETTQGGLTAHLAGAPQLRETLGELDLRVSPEAFLQTNTVMAERLYAIAVELAGLQGWERVYDLFSGIGTIALTVAAQAGEVWGIEVVEDAVADAIANARRNQLADTTHFHAGDVRLALRDLVARAGRPDVLVVDPPRAGLSQKVVRRIVEAAPKRVVYVSCNPTTLAPNAAQLTEAGYVLRRVRPVDMFPQTPHVECVAVLDLGVAP
jgi:23S rRNA (uracil1939-C5)-methyltransferase